MEQHTWAQSLRSRVRPMPMMIKCIFQMQINSIFVIAGYSICFLLLGARRGERSMFNFHQYYRRKRKIHTYFFPPRTSIQLLLLFCSRFPSEGERLHFVGFIFLHFVCRVDASRAILIFYGISSLVVFSLYFAFVMHAIEIYKTAISFCDPFIIRRT